MTTKSALMLALIAMLAACGSGNGTNPVNRPDQEEEDEGASPEPTETELETADQSITRYEEENEATGSGYARNVSYNAATDEFTVDNLGFDGNNVYTRDAVNLGPFAVYEAADTFFDSLTNEPIDQLTPYKAIYGVSGSGDVEFAIVRNGRYVDYGFGGWVYSRNGSVTLPTSGQAGYSGDYAGIRDFSGRGGVEYTTGDMTMSIDFEDFNAGDAVQGSVTNRQVYDIDGNEITGDILTALETAHGVPFSELPAIVFSVGPGSLQDNGEIKGDVVSVFTNDGGALEALDTGNYYGVISGDDAEEVVGVIVVEASDARYEGVTVRETGGFILGR